MYYIFLGDPHSAFSQSISCFFEGEDNLELSKS